MNVIRLILDFLFYRWLADKTSARDINNYKGLAKLELLDISKRVGFLLHLITVYLLLAQLNN